MTLNTKCYAEYVLSKTCVRVKIQNQFDWNDCQEFRKNLLFKNK